MKKKTYWKIWFTVCFDFINYENQEILLAVCSTHFFLLTHIQCCKYHIDLNLELHPNDCPNYDLILLVKIYFDPVSQKYKMA